MYTETYYLYMIIHIHLMTFCILPYLDTVPVSPVRWMIAIVAPVVIATWGLKRKSLDRSGAIAGMKKIITVAFEGGVKYFIK